jgi:hypothetical protein
MNILKVKFITSLLNLVHSKKHNSKKYQSNTQLSKLVMNLTFNIFIQHFFDTFNIR